MFEKIKEQLEAKNLLLNAIEKNKINHCYIFCGPDGTGRFPLAENFSKALICRHGTACGECTACRQFEEKTSPDLKITDLMISNGKEKTVITVDQIREIVSDVYIKPSVFNKKIYIIKNADKMNTNAQNALLKVLEEPPQYVLFILIVKNTQSILPTILSRGTAINFSPLSDKAIKEILYEKFDTEIPDSMVLLSGGSAKEAYNLASSEEHRQIRSEILNAFCNFLREKNERTQLLLYKAMLKYEKEKVFIINVMNNTIADISKENKNSDISYENINIQKQTLYDIFYILSSLLMRFNSNVNYSLAVFSATEEIKKTLLYV